MHTQHLVGILVAQHLDHAVGFLHGTCPAARRKREYAAAAGIAGSFQRLLRLADPGDLGLGVDNRGDGVVIHFGLLSGDTLGDGNTFF